MKCDIDNYCVFKTLVDNYLHCRCLEFFYQLQVNFSVSRSSLWPRPLALTGINAFFCQRHIPKLKTNCPADSKLADVGVGYRTLCETVAAFIRLGQLPSDIVPHVQYWDEGDDMESTFMRHRARWHIKCKQKFVHVTKLGRLSAADTTDAADTDTDKELDDEQSTGLQKSKFPALHAVTHPDQSCLLFSVTCQGQTYARS